MSRATISSFQDFASESIDDMMDLDEVLKKIEMRQKLKKAKSMHPYEIHHTDASGFFTNVDDPTRPSGKRKIRRATEERLWDALIDWYIDKNTNVTLAELVERWLTWKETPRNKDNIKRLRASWKAYYEKEPLSAQLIEMPVSKITTLMLREWAESLLKKHYPVDRKKFSRMFTIMNQCMEYAADEDIGIVRENLWERAKKKINKDLIVSHPVAEDDTQVFTDEERLKLKEMIYQDLDRYTGYHATSAGLQILFLFETALRIGECCGLKWTDIHDGRVYVRRQANNSGVREWTKSDAGYRDIPLTEEAVQILQRVKEYNEVHGYNKEWVFQSGNPKTDYRLGYMAADHKLRKLCARMDTIEKSPHKCRKTCISTLLDCPDINNRTVQRFAGHRELSTTFNYYSFERRNKKAQADAINRALSLDGTERTNRTA